MSARNKCPAWHRWEVPLPSVRIRPSSPLACGHTRQVDANAVQLKCAEVLLGEVAPDSLPAWAAEALVGGLDTPALRELAGQPVGESSGVRDMLVKVMGELGEPVPSLPESRVLIVSALANAILSGDLAPEVGAKRVWMQWSEAGAGGEETPAEWLTFVNDATDWEELPDRRDEIAASIRAAAAAVAAR